MRDHLRILGILNIVMGCLTALGGVAVMLITGVAAKVIVAAVAANNPDFTAAAPLVAVIGLGVGIFLLVLAAPVLIGGWGLLNLRPWSRVLMIIVSVLHLFHVPLGTALGVYGLWVLFSDEGRRLLESGGQALPPVPGAYSVATQPQVTYPPAPPAV